MQNPDFSMEDTAGAIASVVKEDDEKFVELLRNRCGQKESGAFVPCYGEFETVKARFLLDLHESELDTETNIFLDDFLDERFEEHKEHLEDHLDSFFGTHFVDPLSTDHQMSKERRQKIINFVTSATGAALGTLAITVALRKFKK